MSKRNIIINLIFVSLVIRAGNLAAQSSYSPEVQVIYYFTKYVEWPANFKQENFVIGVYHDDVIYEQLSKGITGRRVGNQRITISKIDELSRKQLDVAILYMGESPIVDIKKAINLLASMPVLVVTKLNDKTINGISMNLKIVNEKINLEIDKNNIEGRGLKIASELLALDKASR